MIEEFDHTCANEENCNQWSENVDQCNEWSGSLNRAVSFGHDTNQYVDEKHTQKHTMVNTMWFTSLGIESQMFYVEI